MRFITEFELEADRAPEWHIEHSQRRMGEMLQEYFGLWETNFISRNGTAAVKRSLEIEAFPMDKWVEFKQFLFTELSKTIINSADILNKIKDLEFYSNNKKQVDEIVNQQLNK